MKTDAKIAIAAAAVSLGLAAPAAAQSYGNGEDRGQTQMQGQQMQGQQMQGQQMQGQQTQGQQGRMLKSEGNRSEMYEMARTTRPFRGEITNLKTVKRRDTGGEHLVARLRGDNGQYLIVDLGDARQWNMDAFQTGERLVANGQPGRVGNRLVLFAEEVMLQDQRAKVDRQSGEKKLQRPGDYRQIKGKVQRTAEVGIRGQREPVTLAYVSTDTGDYVVDLGTVGGAKNLEGGEISLRGRDVRVRDRIVLLADQFRYDGKTYTVARPARIAYMQRSSGRMASR